MRRLALGEHLQRADDASPVPGIDPSRGGGIRRAQPFEEHARPDGLELGLEPGAHRLVARREAEVEEHARHVQPGSPDEDRVRSPREDRVDRGARVALVPGHGGVLGDLEHVEKMMRDAAPLVERELGRADVHSAIELHRVGVDDLRRPPVRREGRGEIERELALAGAGRADDGEEPRCGPSMPAHRRLARSRLGAGLAHSPTRSVGSPSDTARGAPAVARRRAGIRAGLRLRAIPRVARAGAADAQRCPVRGVGEQVEREPRA